MITISEAIKAGMSLIAFEERFTDVSDVLSERINVMLIYSPEHADTMIAALTSSDVEHHKVYHPMVNSDWYPFGVGDTYEAAMADLRRRLAMIGHQDKMSFMHFVGMYNEAVKAGDVPNAIGPLRPL